TTAQEESTYSREFWMFIGALVLVVACVQMIASTSIPVFNAIFGTDVAPPIDPIAHYNKWQGAFAVVILLLTGYTQHLKYKKTQVKKFWKVTIIIVVLSTIISGAIIYYSQLYTHLM